jgi:hypothetical protein
MITALKSVIMILAALWAGVALGAGCPVISDDFTTGSGVFGAINGWEGIGNETKEYNVAGSGGTYP